MVLRRESKKHFKTHTNICLIENLDLDPKKCPKQKTGLHEEVESPEKSYFSFMAGRGAAPLDDQVKSMSCVLAGLQDKLTRLEGMMMQSQVSQMQQSIMELSEQCWHLQSSVSAKSCLNAKAEPFVPCTDWGSDDSTSVGSD